MFSDTRKQSFIAPPWLECRYIRTILWGWLVVLWQETKIMSLTFLTISVGVFLKENYSSPLITAHIMFFLLLLTWFILKKTHHLTSYNIWNRNCASNSKGNNEDTKPSDFMTQTFYSKRSLWTVSKSLQFWGQFHPMLGSKVTLPAI